MSRAICILGMHRSGTSLVAHAVAALGPFFGRPEELAAPAYDNPTGFCERLDVTDLHERLLARLSSRWDTTFPLPAGWHRAPEVAPFRDELTRLVQGAGFLAHDRWGWKEPRTCLTLPLWTDVLADLGVPVDFLLVFRNPLDVAASLGRRNGFPRAASYGIWLNYNLHLLTATRGARRAFVRYGDLLAAPREVLRRLAGRLEIAWPEDEEGFAERLDALVRPDLCHSTESADELSVRAPGVVAELWEALEPVLAGDREAEPALDDAAERLHGSLADAWALLRHDVSRNAEVARQDRLDGEAARRDAQRAADLAASLQEVLNERARVVELLGARTADLERELAARDADLAGRDADVAARDAELAAREADLAARATELAHERGLVRELAAARDGEAALRMAAEGRAEALARRAASLADELGSVQRSRLWRAAEPYWRLRRLLAGRRAARPEAAAAPASPPAAAAPPPVAGGAPRPAVAEARPADGAEEPEQVDELAAVRTRR